MSFHCLGIKLILLTLLRNREFSHSPSLYIYHFISHSYWKSYLLVSSALQPNQFQVCNTVATRRNLLKVPRQWWKLGGVLGYAKSDYSTALPLKCLWGSVEKSDFIKVSQKIMTNLLVVGSGNTSPKKQFCRK